MHYLNFSEKLNYATNTFVEKRKFSPEKKLMARPEFNLHNLG